MELKWVFLIILAISFLIWGLTALMYICYSMVKKVGNQPDQPSGPTIMEKIKFLPDLDPIMPSSKEE